MERRNFIKALGSAVAALAVPFAFLRREPVRVDRFTRAVAVGGHDQERPDISGAAFTSLHHQDAVRAVRDALGPQAQSKKAEGYRFERAICSRFRYNTEIGFGVQMRKGDDKWRQALRAGYNPTDTQLAELMSEIKKACS